MNLPSRRRCVLVAAVSLVLPAALTRSAAAQERRAGLLDADLAPEVVDLRITGVKAVDADQLRASIETDESHCRGLVIRFTICPFYKGDAVYQRAYLDRVEFRRDVLRIKLFYFQRGYRDAQVDTAVVDAGDNRVRVAFEVTEGEPTRVDTVIVERPRGIVSARRARRARRIREGQPLDLIKIDSTVLRVREALNARGFADAEVGSRVTVDTAARAGRVVIAVDPKRRTTIDTILIRGNSRVSEETIRNSLTFNERDVFRLSDMLEGQRTLYESGLFRRAELAPLPPTDTTRAQVDSAKTVVVTVQEAPPRAVRTSVGFNTFEFFQVGGRYTNYNLLGGARRLDFSGALGNLGAEQLNNRFIFKNDQLERDAAGRYFAPTYQASADVTQRWLGSPRNTLSGGVFAQRRSSPLVFVDQGYGASATFTRELAPRFPLSANYRFETTRVDAGDIYFCVNFGVCDRGTIDALSGRQKLSPLAITTTTDRGDDAFSPTSGYRLRADVEHASRFTASDFRYNRISLEGSYYRPTFGGVLATHFRAGGVRGVASTNDATGVGTDTIGTLIHPRKRFYAGGAQSVRGFGENQLGPRVLTIPAGTLRGREVVVSPAGDTTIRNNLCPASTSISSCNPNAVGVNANGDTVRLSPADFVPRPVGGDRLLEGSAEYRFNILPRFNLGGALFVDGAVVSGLFLGQRETNFAVTPGFGFRYRSPVGPIRIDIGYNPAGPENLRVITENDLVTDSTANEQARRLVRLQGITLIDENGNPYTINDTRNYAAYKRGGKVSDALGRFVLHLSIGEAF